MNRLPLVLVELRVKNPEWTKEMGADHYYVYRRLECEVVQLNLSAGTMRVRYTWQGSICTADVKDFAFFDSYAIVEK